MSKTRILHVYKQLLKESQKFSDFNFRSYAVRRTQDAFREHRDESNPERIAHFLKEAEDNLAVVKRQVVVGDLYRAEKVLLDTL